MANYTPNEVVDISSWQMP